MSGRETFKQHKCVHCLFSMFKRVQLRRSHMQGATFSEYRSLCIVIATNKYRYIAYIYIYCLYLHGSLQMNTDHRAEDQL